MDFLCIEMMNSNKVDWRHSKNRRDMLDDGTWRVELAQKWNLTVPSKILDSELARLKQLRADMQAVVVGLQKGSNITDAAFYRINQVLKSVAVVSQLSYENDIFQIEQIPDTKGWQLFIWHVVNSFAKLLTEREVIRLKVCQNNDCGWIFYDESKNKSRKWCDEKVCGNIMKVRNFRARQKEQIQ